MKIVFLGTMNNSTPTTINTLSPMLEPFFSVKTKSPFKNRFLCFLDLIHAALTAKSTDLVFIHTYSTLAFYYAWCCGWICQKRGVKYIPYLHGGDLPQRLDKNEKWVKKYFLDATSIITPSGYLKEAMEQRGLGPVTLIPNFIDIHKYNFSLRSNLQPRLLWVRAFHQIYNPDMAVHVLVELRKKYSGATLCMVGPDKDGSMERCVELAKSLNVSDGVFFTGKISQKEWIALSGDYDIFINTTNVDNTPVSVIEAMALGLPVISTNVGGIPFLLEHGKTARLVAQGDMQMMCNEIRFLLINSRESQAQAKNARQLVEHFAWEQVKPQWQKIIHELYAN